MPTLILSPRYTTDSRLIRAAAEQAGWQVVRLTNRRIPGWLEAQDLAFYGEPGFIDAAAATRDIILLRPTHDWLVSLPLPYTKRMVRMTTLDEALRQTVPMFVKPALTKCFPAAIYPTSNSLSAHVKTLAGATPVLLAEPVVWEAEYRCFIVDRQVVAVSPYLRLGALAQAADGSWPFSAAERDDVATFISQLVADPGVALPPAVVVDIGTISGRGWAVVEANEAWGAGIYGCDAGAALLCLARAAVPLHRLSATDRPWTRG